MGLHEPVCWRCGGYRDWEGHPLAVCCACPPLGQSCGCALGVILLVAAAVTQWGPVEQISDEVVRRVCE